MDDKFPMTPRGQQTMKDELRRLKEERPRISKEIEEARAHGDLSENAEYTRRRRSRGTARRASASWRRSWPSPR